LSKPSVSAWVVNQLYWRHGYLFGRLIDAGKRLRQAQTTREASNLSELVNARREVVAALATNAADLLREAAYSDTRDVMRRVTSTLEALSAYGSLPGAPVAGRLTVDLEPPGFETLAGLVPPREAIKLSTRETPTSGRQPAAKDTARGREQQRLVTAAKSAVRKAERDLGVARQQEERAAAEVKTAAARAKRSDGQRAKLEKQLAGAAKEADAAHENERAAQAEAREAALAAENAERELQLARSRLEQLADEQD
ncbi:MAG TPA: hypothetical protein VMV37_08620, partial [Gammaproteobacteria bacterium]|nr:hypothetical protein [Gammaproteobacteria bacterium]